MALAHSQGREAQKTDDSRLKFLINLPIPLITAVYLYTRNTSYRVQPTASRPVCRWQFCVGVTSFYHSGFLLDLRQHPEDDPLAYHYCCRRRVDCRILRHLGSPSSTREVLRGGYACTNQTFRVMPRCIRDLKFFLPITRCPCHHLRCSERGRCHNHLPHPQPLLPR
jgi:hypothetical protein